MNVFKIKTLNFLLLLAVFGAACNVTSLQDLEDELIVCLSGGYLCAELQEEIDRRERRKAERESSKARCPDGMVAVCDSRHHRGCGSRLAQVKEYTCMRRADVEWMRRGW